MVYFGRPPCRVKYVLYIGVAGGRGISAGAKVTCRKSEGAEGPVSGLG